MARVQALLANPAVWPPIVTLTMLIWTGVLYRHTKYEDYWASYPLVAAFLLTVCLHIWIAYKQRWELKYILYGAIHLSVAFLVCIFCLMLITKDSL